MRSVRVEDGEEWYFSIVDVVSVLTESKNPRNYWNKLKARLREEGSQMYTECVQLKMQSAKDGKHYRTDAGTAEQILRFVQSIPSPKAEPFKLWLAQVGKERVDEVFDPELAIERAIEYYRRKGYTEDWISQRLFSIRVRKSLTFEWRERGVKANSEYAILTNDIYRAWSDMTARQYKTHKGLTNESLRDNMSDLELALSTLAEATTAEIERAVDPASLPEHREVARSGGEVAGVARKAAEKKIGGPVITSATAPDFGRLIRKVIEVQAIDSTADEAERTRERPAGTEVRAGRLVKLAATMRGRGLTP
ncbi:BRO-N domain-containing protein [Eggerthella timonensis]|uniref:BRO-N domain-containing protein n=1 Tax=Eggerthella timonensis TaxID=1871008 RepID=UPI001FE96F75|nr:Bro-N domain-containing protein [Eggerthella timonensis]